MRALRINSAERKVEEIQINDWKDIAPAIGNECNTFTCPVIFENEDAIYADDEGLYHPFEGGFMMKDWEYPIVGNAVIQGTDEEGESTEPLTTKEELEAMIIWVDKARCERWASQFN